MSKKLGLAFGLVAFLNLFLFHRIGSVATILIMGAYLVFVVGTADNKPKLVLTYLTGLYVILSYILLRSAGYIPRFLVFVTLASIITGSIYLLQNNKKWFSNLGELISVPFMLGFSWLASAIHILVNVFTKRDIRPGIPLIRGLLLGLPAVFILASLLSSGDPVFKYYLGTVFSWEFWRLPVVHTIFSLFLLIVFLPVAFLRKYKNPIEALPGKEILTTELKVVMAMVAIVLGAFLIVQWNYVFVSVAAETSLSKFGITTYSEYVNRGFGEFILTAIIVYWVIRAGLKNKLWSVILAGEFGIFIASMMRRIYLYQNFHGWTLARIYGGVFLIWVTGLVLILVSRLSIKKNLLNIEARWMLLVILFVGIFNAENFIVVTKPPTVNNQTDYVYLSRMSPDGIEGWKKAFGYSQSILRKDYPAGPIGQEEKRQITDAGIIIENLIDEYNLLSRNYDQNNEIDKLLVWNYQENKSFGIMKKDFDKNRLDELLSRFHLLINRKS